MGERERVRGRGEKEGGMWLASDTTHFPKALDQGGPIFFLDEVST